MKESGTSNELGTLVIRYGRNLILGLNLVFNTSTSACDTGQPKSFISNREIEQENKQSET